MGNVLASCTTSTAAIGLALSLGAAASAVLLRRRRPPHPDAAGVGELRSLDAFLLTEILACEPTSIVLLGTFEGHPGVAALVKARPKRPGVFATIDATPPTPGGGSGGGVGGDGTKGQAESNLAVVAGALHGASLSLDNTNRAYGYYSAAMPGLRADGWSVEVVWPAGERVVRRHRAAEWRLVRETPAMYEAVTREVAFSEATTSSNGWIYKILDGEAEQEDIVYVGTRRRK